MLWQKQTSVKELDKIFAPFLNAGIDLSVLADITPVLDEKPQIKDNIKLTLNGHYSATPNNAYFDYSFIKEDGNWKLIGFNLHIK